MLQNKKTPSEVSKQFKSVKQDPEVLQKRFQRHAPQKLTIRIDGDDIDPDGSLNFTVNSKLMEDLPDECLVGCESFFLNQGTTISYPVNLNVTSPLFVSGRQYIPTWSNAKGQYSGILASIMTPEIIAPGAWTAVCSQQQVLANGLGCFNTNKQILNNFNIPFSITAGNTDTAYKVNKTGFSLQMTLVFYGLNDDERYSMIPQGIYS
jgi:hypothetical protein